MATKRMFGVDLHDNGNDAATTEFDDHEELYKWFNEHPDSGSGICVRLLCVQIESFSGEGPIPSQFDIPLPPSVVESAVWKPEVYHNLASNAAGGAAGLTDEPFRFILQTPLDGGPFCSLAIARKGNIAKGIYFFDEQSLNPADMTGGDASLSAWRSNGVQIITLPHKFLQVHSVDLSQRLARTIARVRAVETNLVATDQTPPNFSSLGRILHACSMELVDIERRSRFEQSVVEAIETIVLKYRHGTLPWPPLSPQQAALASRKFDFESLPRRMENARTTINGLIQQRTQALNLELTQASHRIAEASLSDSRSMKTIAILTMVLLPGTAVASLFSMNLFDWSAADGGQIASKWLWIYFVVTVPLTGMIIALWWYWNRRSLRSTVQYGPSMNGSQNPFRDEETGMSEPQSFEGELGDVKPGS